MDIDTKKDVGLQRVAGDLEGLGRPDMNAFCQEFGYREVGKKEKDERREQGHDFRELKHERQAAQEADNN